MIAYLLIFLSMATWLVALKKQHNTKYFILFLIIALFPPAAVVISYVFKISVNNFHPCLYMALIASIMSSSKKKIVYYVSCVLMLAIPFIRVNNVLLFTAITIMDVILLIMIARDNVVYYIRNNHISLFLLMLLLYFSISIFQNLALSINYLNGIISFYLGYAFQIIMGIFFWFINIDTKLSLLRKIESLGSLGGYNIKQGK